MDAPPKDFDGHDRRSGGGVRMRLFGALRVPPASAALLADVADAVAGHAPRARAATVSDLHVTWAFLGDVAEEFAPAIASAFESAAFDVPGALECSLGAPVLLGGGRALALEVHVDLGVLLDAARDAFLDATAPYALHADRRAWRPHVTLVRAATGEVLPETLARVAATVTPSTRWVVPELQLYASLPGPSGHQHRLLHAVPFGAPVYHA